MASLISARTGKLVVDIDGTQDFALAAAAQRTGGLWLAGLSNHEGHFDVAQAQVTSLGTLDMNYRGTGSSREPANLDNLGSLSTNVTVTAGGTLLLSQVVTERGVDYLQASAFYNLQGPPTVIGQPIALPESSTAWYTRIQILDSGKWVLAAGSGDHLSVARFNADGSPDLTFARTGHAQFDLAEGVGGFQAGNAVTVQNNGQVLVAGYTGNGDYLIQRYNSDGSLDPHFSNAGLAQVDLLGDSAAQAIAVQPDGKVVVAGQTMGDFSVVRLNLDGSLDTTFGDNGRAQVDVDGRSDSVEGIQLLANGKIQLVGSAGVGADKDFASVRLNADGSLDSTWGALADGKHHIDGSNSDNIIIGTDGDDILFGAGGDDLLDGGLGRDILTGSVRNDTFRFSALDDSYRTADQSFADRITDFDPGQDFLDLSRLGLNGFGDGHNGTLKVQVNAAGTVTYLKSLDADANGHRFEVAIDGNVASKLYADANVYFSPQVLAGGSGNDLLQGNTLSGILTGYDGDDRLRGGAGDEVLDGGQGRDIMSGGMGHDTFRYTSMFDSYRDATTSHADRLLDFDTFTDKIDVSQVGFTGLGDGHNGTLAVAVDGRTTYLKSYDADADGNRFQISLAGDLSGHLSESNFVFAPVAVVGVAEEPQVG
ncbi:MULTISPECIES: M10 family metallopeptidase C-terminal domain-containing protein [unclassified Pseudomonas]|uniref:M10 family metallopeptidase C-terminal domain-containing protein n=1 Tax=unclassified Pseudomonas TaxID=196821 RepID=UPI000BCDA89E|nr:MULTISPECIES: M10 family metallopeptidase C-terminal domain-containing protein [unclassified Pseudomonas]PVZ13661.1 putative delta-60 repeat protein [Pseudomonas sp. URIL14HWK12:I12]PVZ23967.1 putative delta-60 repeat protein [Pseudomonas sp. URIL14HWK12:I10]PVZ33394.1 putative delta-60 repeat protein [Pseudomonas sp. URIL14HWK12:I11]SNZ11405.1 delta-60 repeat domain-containing protein [Pseudomonas sp. URIL14HWK12:I9]